VRDPNSKPGAVVIMSGGMDSVTLAWNAMSQGYTPHIITFDYGQRHGRREIECAKWQAHEMNRALRLDQVGGVKHDIIDLRSINVLLRGSSLTDASMDVPEGHYAEDNMKATIVPNRNAIMLSIAYGAAVANGDETVFAAMHAGDHAIYPDCRPDFISALNEALRIGNAWANPMPYIETPFIGMTKADIARRGSVMGVDFSHTWSCYKGLDVHCGACGTCVERIEAFRLAGLSDPTEYDPEGLRKYEELAEAGRVG